MEIYLQLVWNSLVFGLLSAILAASFSLIYSVSRVLHLVHGAVVLLGGYFFYLLSLAGFSFLPALGVSALLCGLTGLSVNVLVYEVMRSRRHVAGASFMIVSLGGLIVLQNLILAIWGSKTIRLASPFDTMEKMMVGGVNIEPLSLTIVLSAIGVFVGLSLLLRHTRFGVALRAISDNEEMAEIVGVSAWRVRQWTFFLCSSVAGGFGALYGLLINIYPHQATYNAIDAFSVSLVGGLGSVIGALISGVSLALVSNFGGFWMKAVLQNVFVFSGIFVFLLFRPQGLFGKKKN